METPLLPDHLISWLDSRKWTYAKSMPQCHHFYANKNWMSPKDKAVFVEMVTFLRKHGYWAFWYKTKNKYLRLGESFKCWTMGAAIRETYILNIAHKDITPTENIYLDPNLGIFSPRPKKT